MKSCNMLKDHVIYISNEKGENHVVCPFRTK